MLEILQFIFSSFWIWLGFSWLVLLIAAGLSGIFNISIIHNHYDKNNEPENKDKQ